MLTLLWGSRHGVWIRAAICAIHAIMSQKAPLGIGFSSVWELSWSSIMSSLNPCLRGLTQLLMYHTTPATSTCYVQTDMDCVLLLKHSVALQIDYTAFDKKTKTVLDSDNRGVGKRVPHHMALISCFLLSAVSINHCINSIQSYTQNKCSNHGTIRKISASAVYQVP